MLLFKPHNIQPYMLILYSNLLIINKKYLHMLYIDLLMGLYIFHMINDNVDSYHEFHKSQCYIHSRFRCKLMRHDMLHSFHLFWIVYLCRHSQLCSSINCLNMPCMLHLWNIILGFYKRKLVLFDRIPYW